MGSTQSTWGTFKLNNLFIMVAFSASTTSTVCGVGSKVTLSGNIGVAWATEAIVKVATAVLTKSDGYQIVIATTNSTAAVVGAGKYGGGCIKTADSNAVCNTYLAATDSSYVATTMQKVTVVLAADWKLATALTVVDTNIAFVPIGCSGAASVTTFALLPACTDTSGSLTTAVQTLTYFQPKEDPKKVYAGVPRFSKGDSVSMFGPSNITTDALNLIFALCGEAKVMTGASALVAGAAVAFGAAALAF